MRGTMTYPAALLSSLPPPLRWLARRLVLPALAATLAVEAMLFVAWGATLFSVPLEERANLFPLYVLLRTGLITGIGALFVIGFGLLLFGVPAGYLVARLDLGFGPSLAGLAALGALAGAMLMLLLALATGGLSSVALGGIALFAASGAATAAVWTSINADLFRRDDRA